MSLCGLLGELMGCLSDIHSHLHQTGCWEKCPSRQSTWGPSPMKVGAKANSNKTIPHVTQLGFHSFIGLSLYMGFLSLFIGHCKKKLFYKNTICHILRIFLHSSYTSGANLGLLFYQQPCCMGLGRRPWEAHQLAEAPDDLSGLALLSVPADLIPVPALCTLHIGV